MYLMEGLAFQHLQNELGASILREVEIELTNSRKVQVDGLLQTPNATVAVEVFIVRGESTGTLDRARVLRDLFANAVREGSKAKKPYRLIGFRPFGGSVCLYKTSGRGFCLQSDLPHRSSDIDRKSAGKELRDSDFCLIDTNFG